MNSEPSTSDFFIGQEGHFIARNALGKPDRIVSGKILSLIQTRTSTWALVDTPNGRISVRLL